MYCTRILTIYQFYFERSQLAIICSKNIQLQELNGILNSALPQKKKKKVFKSHADPSFEKIDEPDPLPSMSGT